MNTKRLIHQVFLLAPKSRTPIVTATLSKRAAAILPSTKQIPRLFSTTTTCRNGNMMQDKKCWACQSTNKPSALFCENKVCSVIQPIPSQLNFFHLLQVGTGENR
jgi:hypothetical protein